MRLGSVQARHSGDPGLSSADELLAVARLGAPRGLHGHLKLHSFSGEFGHLAKLRSILASSEGSPERAVTLKVLGRETGEWGMSMSFEGYETPEKARKLTGLVLYLPRKDASALRPNEWYIRDLVGLSMVHGGRVLGKVTAVLDGAADPLLEIARAEGSTAAGTVLVPFRNQFIGEVDCAGGTIELLAEWLLE